MIKIYGGGEREGQEKTKKQPAQCGFSTKIEHQFHDLEKPVPLVSTQENLFRPLNIHEAKDKRYCHF
jgi:hypothetical protein